LDKAGKQYWDRVWEGYNMPQAVNPQDKGLANHVNRCFHEYFCQIFSNMNTQGKKVLEIGCARSVWLPYFAKEFGFKIYGIDYSEIGCQQAREVLSNAGVEGEIVYSDLFSPPESLVEIFDVVISFGVVEHFEDTSRCIKGISRFLKPGGLMITNIPNLMGLMGLVQKIANRDVFYKHVPLFPKDLNKAHRCNGLKVVSCNYFLFANFGVLNLENLKGSRLFEWVIYSRSWFNNAIWTLEKVIPFLKPNRWSSPYINCASTKVGNTDGN
jgi:2-polyprenyl-3-methyl-5-hydroxy-6-metoxy-1,4-benzoquinol methylase